MDRPPSLHALYSTVHSFLVNITPQCHVHVGQMSNNDDEDMVRMAFRVLDKEMHLPLSVYLFVWLSLFLSFFLSVCLSICLSVGLSIFQLFSFCLHACLSFRLSVCLSFCLLVQYVSLHVCQSVYQSVFLHAFLPVFLDCLFVFFLPVCLPFPRLLYLFSIFLVCLFLCLTILLGESLFIPQVSLSLTIC